jgi:20S proteasome alpha/beta subunit
VLDNHYKEGMSLEEGKTCINDCIKELQTRFIISQPEFLMKTITKDGTKVEKL